VDVPEVSLIELVAMDTPQSPQYGTPSSAAYRVIRDRRHQVRHCLELAQRANPNLSGRMTLHLDVADGQVTAVEVIENTAQSTQLEACISRRISRWTFPPDLQERIALPLAFN
jgi:hypothetical protein